MRSHQVAAVAYIVHNRKFLLMKRSGFPKIWGPPGGRLEQDEAPEDGLRREIREESGLEIEIVQVVDIWYGDFGKGKYISLDYLALSAGAEVRLSDEHKDWLWSSIEELRAGQPPLARSDPGFKMADFEQAWRLYLMFEENGYIVDGRLIRNNPNRI